ncbi:MAG TPA: fused MFS/spermidine synthase [Burkholderiales bacterium]|nr:fused MFS/spermidine synthase [Burkholderiales bacterium]
MSEEPIVANQGRGEFTQSPFDRLFVLTFSATLFGSALLMFYLQPLVGKLLLPKLGGAPQVWSACMVFFQAMLLAGYLHAHYTGVLFGLRRQAAIHLVLVAVALFALPIGFSSIVASPDENRPVLWLMQVLTVSVGAPMFIIASTAPLLQKWFSNTNHPTARDPYYLYAASNLGSLLALLSYPVIIEPFLDLGQQTQLFRGGFVALGIALAVCAFLFYRNYLPQTNVDDAVASIEREKITWPQRLRWVLLSFAPASLLLGVTTYITTDIAAVPLLWIAPLALYLGTFVLAFARTPPISPQRVVYIQVFLVVLLSILSLNPENVVGLLEKLLLHLAVFFATALMCHGELARDRPGPRHLTEFYLWLSLGGVLGGAFNALAAPLLFVVPIEYPLALALACMLRPRFQSADVKSAPRKRNVLLPVFLFVAILIIMGLFMMRGVIAAWAPMAIGWALVAVASLGAGDVSRNPNKIGWIAALTLGVALLLPGVSQVAPFQTATPVWRGFFGVYRIQYDKRRDVNILIHGTTGHGAQPRNPELRNQPITYYHLGGPFGDLFRALSHKLSNGQVAILGLGIGGLTCHGMKDSVWTYYEIDPLVERIARDAAHFTYLRDCPPKVNVIVGDARLKLRDAPNSQYNLIVADAFSSDAIPTHLLTKEAIAGYLTKLTADGVLAIQITNNYLNLEPAIANLAAELHLVGRVNRNSLGDSEKGLFGLPARLIVLARNNEALGDIAKQSGWRELIARPGSRVWSDDYVNILSVLERPEL